MDKNQLTKYATRILNAIGITDTENCLSHYPVLNSIKTKNYLLEGVELSVEVTVFDYKESATCRIDIDFSLPENGVLADTFMDHCAGIEKTPKNHHHEYCAGPAYPDFVTELEAKKRTFALSPWNNNMFYVRSEGYLLDDIDTAVGNAIALAVQFTRNFSDLASMHYWNTTDPEVITKANEIIANADLYESDIDREDGGHWIRDRKSFIKGWFFPFRDSGRGAFDVLWPSSLEYAASNMGNEGTFEYAVACRVLVDDTFISKARKACVIRKKIKYY